MYRFLARPKWIAFTVVVLLAVVAMIGLGLWQLRRLDERRDFNAQVRGNGEQPIEALDAVLTPGAEAESIEWRPVGVSGTYLPEETVLVVNRSQGGQVGRNAVTPLQLDDGSLLLVNRGFVPGAEAVPAPPEGRVEIIGRLRRSERRRAGQPEDASGVELEEVRRVDIDKLAAQLPATVAPMYLERTASDPAEQEIMQPVAGPELSEGPHLSYALQWFVFSICAVIGWVLVVRRTARPADRRPRRGPPPILESER